MSKGTHNSLHGYKWQSTWKHVEVHVAFCLKKFALPKRIIFGRQSLKVRVTLIASDLSSSLQLATNPLIFIFFAIRNPFIFILSAITHPHPLILIGQSPLAKRVSESPLAKRISGDLLERLLFRFGFVSSSSSSDLLFWFRFFIG